MRESVIKRLIKLVEESNIEELEVSRWGRKVRISKKARPASAQNPSLAPPSMAPTKETSPAQKGAAVVPLEAEEGNLVDIKSPMVGTFYRAPTPEADPYVKVGQAVDKGSVVCIVEAMKLMNEIESEVSGRIVKVLVEDSQPVEFGQSLFLVEPA
jgi:acetyl-CoA carboxylase biotin carboxyl carrier protein